MIWLAAALAASAPHWVSVSTVSAGTLQQECKADHGNVLDPCGAYILGVADTLQIQEATCRPQSDVATAQTLAVVRRYLNEHPEQWNLHAAIVVAMAMKAAFPCRR